MVYGGFAADDGFVEGNIGRHPVNRKRMAVVPKGGKAAYTAYHVEERFPAFTHLSVRLRTGRTHQILSLIHIYGEVVSADSMQIYKGLRVGTAQATPEEMKGVPHHLVGFLPPDERFSVAAVSYTHLWRRRSARRGNLRLWSCARRRLFWRRA